MLWTITLFISVPKLCALVILPYIYFKVGKALRLKDPDQSLKIERQQIETSNILDFTEGFKLIYVWMNAYISFIKDLIMLRKPIKNFGQATGLLVLSIAANKFGDSALLWSYVFFLLIPPLIRSREAH